MGYELVIGLLSFVSVMALGGAVLEARSARRELLEKRLREFGSHGADQKASNPMREMLQRLGGAVSPSGPSSKLRERLGQAGFYGRSAASVFLGAKVVILIAATIALAVLVGPMDMVFYRKVLLVVLGAGLLSFLPNILVDMRLRARRLDIRHHLPDAIDLLEICVSSGMGLDAAWNAVADEVQRVCQPLTEEMSLTNLEMHLGATRATALRHMAERTGADEISSLVSVLVQSERFGTSIGDALRVFAGSMRELRSQRASESAEKMAVKLLFPMVVFIFPAVLIAAAGPAGIKIWTHLQ